MSDDEAKPASEESATPKSAKSDKSEFVGVLATATSTPSLKESESATPENGEEAATPTPTSGTAVQIPTAELEAYLQKDNLLAWYCGFVEEQSGGGISRLNCMVLSVCCLLMDMMTGSRSHAAYMCQLIAITYPTALSMYTMELDEPKEAGAWLLYWILWAIACVSGITHADQLFILPTTALFTWLWFPPTDGIHILYNKLVRCMAVMQHGRFDADVWTATHASVKMGVAKVDDSAKKHLQTCISASMLKGIDEAQNYEANPEATPADKKRSPTSVTAEQRKKEREKAEQQIMTNLFTNMNPEQVKQIVTLAQSAAKKDDSLEE